MSIESSPSVARLRLLQLASPALPVGGYAYSQGLEWAVSAGWVHDEASLASWLAEQFAHGLALVDLPIFARLYRATRAGDDAAQTYWARELMARRETNELVADDRDRGQALARLLRDLKIAAGETWLARADTPLAALTAAAAVAWDIPLPAAAEAYAWSWLENQVIAGVKLIPLGQVAGQRLLLELSAQIPAACERALDLADEDIGGTLPMLALASCRHETQYTRLFRS